MRRILPLMVVALVAAGCGTRGERGTNDTTVASDTLEYRLLRRAIGFLSEPVGRNLHVSLPRVVDDQEVDGFRFNAAMGMGSWATIYRSKDDAGVVGELFVRPSDSIVARKAIEEAGLQVNRAAPWIGADGPPVLSVAFSGKGSQKALGESVNRLGHNMAAFPGGLVEGDTVDVPNSLDVMPLGFKFVSRGQVSRGVFRLRVPRRELEVNLEGEPSGEPQEEALGFENYLFWQGSPERAAVVGQVSMLAPAIDGYREILEAGGFATSEPLSPEVGETPEIWLVRILGVGPLDELVSVLRDGLSATAVHEVPDGFRVETISRHLDQDADAFAMIDEHRFLVAHQRSGKLELLVNGSLREEPILTVPNLLWSSEQGFVGVTVDPMYPDSNYVYTFHTRKDSVNRVSRYEIHGDLTDPNSDRLYIDESSLKVLVEVYDAYQFHNGGTVRFGPDDKLYVSTGDDATLRNIQDLTYLKAKILRINRDGSAPDDNPVFPNEPAGRRKEIFAIGFRNPFRFTIDPKTGELLVADVGSVYIEEYNVSRGGENFGWPLFEGDRVVYKDAKLIPPDPPTFPLYQYDRPSPMCAAIALVTYRQRNYPVDHSFPPEYDGTHIVADFRAGPIFHLRPDSNGVWDVEPFATGFSRPVDGTVGPDGSVYVLEYGRALKRILYDRPGS